MPSPKRSLTANQAKMNYKRVPNGDVVGWSQKAGSTLIKKLVYGDICGIHEAWEARLVGQNVVLIMRHPLDRLVSNYVFFQRTESAPIVGAGKDLTIEEWYEFTQSKYNMHWEDQSTLHTYRGVFVPTVVLPWEALSVLSDNVVNPSDREGTWEDYFTPEFKEKMEERYADDLDMYDIAKEHWNGKKPIWFYNSYEEYRVAESAGRNILKGE